MSSAGTAASLFVSRGRLGSVHCRLVGKPARLEQVPLSPKSLSPFSHTNRTWRKDLFVQPGARGRAVVLHKALLTGQNLRLEKGQVWLVCVLVVEQGLCGLRGDTAVTSHGAQACVTPCPAAPTGATIPSATRGGWHVLCRSPARPECRSIPSAHLCLSAAALLFNRKKKNPVSILHDNPNPNSHCPCPASQIPPARSTPSPGLHSLRAGKTSG